jgi:pimeloyl-ACP methyl ester carboxylesterase/2-polyprenyl-3-methyl-5-hydroxy-6-metoxy-1,4-benzoquinol methylase
LIVLLALGASAGEAPAQEKSLKPGINEGYKSGDIEKAVARFEGEKRDVVKEQEEILTACGLEPGMIVADVGAGTGLFTRLFAPEVAPEGKVYAVDVTEPFVEHVKKTCREQQIENVVGVVCSPTSTKLAPASVDLVFLCDTYHHFEYPFKMLDSIRQALRPEGRLVLIDRKRAGEHVRADQETVREEVAAAGFALVDEKGLTEREYLMRFRKTERAAPARAGAQQPARMDRQIRITMDYLLFLPEEYEKRDSWPLLLFLHGAGERGDDLELVKKHGPPKIVETKKDFPFVVVSPQCRRDRRWEPVSLVALLDEITANFKIDEDRIYVTGLSMGGFGTWSLAAHTPHRFAAIVPICGGGEPRWTRRFAHLPVWVFHGAKDWTVPLERSQEMVDALENHDGNVRFTVYPEAGHDAWTEAYDKPELYQWLLEHKRAAPEPEG